MTYLKRIYCPVILSGPACFRPERYCEVGLDAIIKSMSNEGMLKVSTLESKAEIVQELKTLNGAEGGGIKHFDKLVIALSAVAFDLHGTKTFAELREEFVNHRQHARKLLSYRITSTIIISNKGSDVEALYKEVKALKVKLDKKWTAKLDSLKAAE